MCIICVELDKKNLSPWEAKRNLKEMTEKIGEKHAREVENKISDAIYEELYFNFGDTLHQTADCCAECDPGECDCSWPGD